MRVMRTARPRRRHVVALGLAFASAMLAWCPSAFALNPTLDVSQYGHTAWRLSEGFSTGRITAIAQTPDGYLWLGTEFGLVRFDGVRVVPWQAPAGQHLPNNFIRALLASRDGTLWIGTLKGLASWKAGKLTEYPEFAKQSVDALIEDREGTVWATGTALPTGRLCTIQNGRVECYGQDGSLGAAVESLYEDTRGNVWVGATTGLWRWKPGEPQRYPASDPVAHRQALTEDRGALLISGRSGMRQLVDGRVEEYRVPDAGRSLATTCLLRDRDGGLWMGTFSGLVHVHEGRTDTFGQTEGLSRDAVLYLFEDREGNIWAVTSAGLDRFRGVSVTRLSVKQGLSSDGVGSVLADKDGSVWLGTADGLNRWNKGHITIPSTGGGKPDGKFGGLNPHALLQDHRGRMWVSTEQGIGYLANGHFVAVNGVPPGIVRSMVEDTAGNVWIASQNLGLFRVSPVNDVQGIPWAKLGHQDFALTLAADAMRGGLWLGFYGGGVAYVADGQVRASYAAVNGLGKGVVADLRLEKDGALWAATEGGLSRVKNGRVVTLTSKSGLPCDTVHWSMPDEGNYVWLYMSCGLVRIARSELDAWAAAVDTTGADKETDAKRAIHAIVFDSSDGVGTVAFPTGYSPRVAKSSDGRMWFLSADGVSVIDPGHTTFNTLPPPVHVEQVTADRKNYDATSDSSGQLRLPPLVRDLQIDYTALSLVAPEKNRFKIKLEGWDHDWQDVGNRRQAFYNNLPPRNYRFRVNASNNSGVWNETGAVFDFSIAPAYYQTAWFRTLAVAMLASLLWVAHRIRLRIVERHEAEISALNERLMKAQEQERIRIAGELHDGVMQQISALSLMLGTARRQIPSELEAKAAVGEVQLKLIQVGTDVRQLSHDLHPAMLKEAGLPEALRAYCEEFTNVRGIAVTCDADDRVRELSRGVALALYRIAQEALGNAATHGAAQHATVRLTRSNGHVILSVSDDGKGFEPSRLASGGLGLINMRERARQLNGTFDLDSAPRRGTTVTVTIPFRRAL